MYTRGKWLISLRNRYGYNAVFRKKVYTSNYGPYDHHDFYKIEAIRGNHDVTFDLQKVELHLSHHKITPKLRFGINHPVYWTIQNGEYTMITKDASLYYIPHEWTDEMCILLYFLAIQELSTRSYHLKKYKYCRSHQKAIIKTLFILRYIVVEAKRRDIYYDPNL